MSDTVTELAELLEKADRPADFCVSGVAETFPPALKVEGVGSIALPLLPVQARELIAAAERAPVSMAGYRDHPEVLDMMAKAAIVVVPSRWPEPFGLVALEAMASGAALVCSPRGGLPEVAGEAAIYADPDKIEDIAAALRSLGRDEARRNQLAAAGRVRARQFDLPIVAEQLAGLRRGILG